MKELYDRLVEILKNANLLSMTRATLRAELARLLEEAVAFGYDRAQETAIKTVEKVLAPEKKG